MENFEPGMTNGIYTSPGCADPGSGMAPPDMQVANNVANVLYFGCVWFNVVLIKVDTFTIFDTMESMKGQTNRKPRRTILNELTNFNNTLFRTDFFS